MCLSLSGQADERGYCLSEIWLSCFLPSSTPTFYCMSPRPLVFNISPLLPSLSAGRCVPHVMCVLCLGRSHVLREWVEKRFCLPLVSQQGCVISAGHTTHSWDAGAVWRGHSSLSRTHHTPAVSTLISVNPQLYIMPCKLFCKVNCVREDLDGRLGNYQELQVKWHRGRSAYYVSGVSLFSSMDGAGMELVVIILLRLLKWKSSLTRVE